MTKKWPGNPVVFALCEPRIKGFEGFRAAPYRDSANIPTIGYGTILYPNGQVPGLLVRRQQESAMFLTHDQA